MNDNRNDPSAAVALVFAPVALVCLLVLALSQSIGASFAVTLTFVVWAVAALVVAGSAIFFFEALWLPAGIAASFIWWKGCAVLDSIACGGCNPSSDGDLPWTRSSNAFGLSGGAPFRGYGSEAWYANDWFQWGVFVALVVGTIVLAVRESNSRRYYGW